ncbi:glycosyltransferase family 2 protein [Leucobacter chinensis]|uniref:glycosyltransferase family 2 protein n=1 Tax=Leucobacter chinensis TaxID=2851010 RepID=UPI0035101033
MIKALPAVSYVMPVLNEAGHLRAAVMAVLAQEYSGEQEIVLALGPSTDETNSIAHELASTDERVRIVENPERDIPIGLNLAIEAAHNPIIIRVDAHSELSPGYTERAVELLGATGAANVGGRMQAEGTGPVQRAIAGGYNSPIGLGGGSYHFSEEPHEAESAYLGVFPRSTFDLVGGFNPIIRRGEDWEFNLRVRKAGGTVWFDPELQVTYWPRSSFSALTQQFFATGTWRAKLVRMYGGENPWRFFVPGAYVLALVAALTTAVLHVCGFVAPSAWWPWVLYAAPVAHAGLSLFAGTKMPETKGLRGTLLGALAITIMHLAWGTGFLRGFVFGSSKTLDRSRAS